MKKKRILVAEDDAHIRNGLNDALEAEGYEVVAARDGEEALKKYHCGGCDLVVLDIMMPGCSGFDVCREIRRNDTATPILFLTAKDGETDTVIGLGIGADDYMSKPFGLRELLARIAALLRRSQNQPAPGEADASGRFPFGVATVDRRRHTLTNKNGEAALTPLEMKLIEAFHTRSGKTITRNDLLNEVWGIDYFGTTRTLDQHMAKLRKKVEPNPEEPMYLTTVHGVGYRYEGQQ